MNGSFQTRGVYLQCGTKTNERDERDAHTKSLIFLPVCGLELFRQQFTESLRDGVFAGTQGESIHLSLQVWLQTQQAANLGGFGMYYASTHEICRIWINFFQERRTKSNNLCLSDLCVHRMLCFEDILHFLLWTTKTAC